MKNTAPDIPIEPVDGDIDLSHIGGDAEHQEPDQEINHPPAYQVELTSYGSAEPIWANPLAYTPGIW